MREHIENRQYDPSLRFVLCRWREIKKMPPCDKRSAMLDSRKELIRDARRKLQKIGQTPEYTIIVPDPNYPEYYTLLYKEPFLFEGTKGAFIEHLWETHASYCEPSQYDCTGQHFTTGYKVGHIGGDRWRVAEFMGVDV